MGLQNSLQDLEAQDKSRKCPDCGGIVVYHNDELTCTKCGLVLSD
jgi:ribosomal protein S27AE